MTKAERHDIYKKLLNWYKRNEGYMCGSIYRKISGDKMTKNKRCTLKELALFDGGVLEYPTLRDSQIIATSFAIEMTKPSIKETAPKKKNNQKPIV